MINFMWEFQIETLNSPLKNVSTICLENDFGFGIISNCLSNRELITSYI